MRIAEIKYPDVVNGEGVRVSLWLQGCHRHCKGCFNESTWDPTKGHDLTDKERKMMFALLSRKYVAGLSVLGGEPLEQADELAEFLKEVKKKFPNKPIWLWTGNTYEEVKHLEVFQYVDVCVDGAFREEVKNISLKFRGSENQRIINVSN